MDVGVRLPSAIQKATAANVMRVAEWAETLGFHSVWVSDHVILPERVESQYASRPNGRWDHPADTPWFDPLLTLALAASVAPHVLLGTSVLVLPLRHPVLLAKQLASLDVLSSGRVLLGIGIGWMAEEFRLIGVPFEERAPRAVEMVQLMRALWADRPVDFRGRYWAVSGCRMSPPPSRRSIPVLWGGHSRAALKRVAALGDGWHPSRLPPAELKTSITALRELCERRGRDPASLMLVARLDSELTIDILRHYQDLGVSHVVIDPPLGGNGLEECREVMEMVAATLRLRPRTAGSPTGNVTLVTDSFVPSVRNLAE